VTDRRQSTSCVCVCNRLTRVMMSLARSRAKSGDTKQARPFNATPASYMFWLLRSYQHQPVTPYHSVSSAVMTVKISKSKTTTFCHNRPRSKLWSLLNHHYDLFLQRLLDVAGLNYFTIIIVIVAHKHVGGQWVTLTFDLSFRWAKVRLSPDLSQKVKWFR